MPEVLVTCWSLFHFRVPVRETTFQGKAGKRLVFVWACDEWRAQAAVAYDKKPWATGTFRDFTIRHMETAHALRFKAKTCLYGCCTVKGSDDW